ncbi:MAG: hypothetical protein ACD_83C00046G0006 [uncultured bacterium]|uniref:Pyruvate flavodoxin/ferredoxin oxidoreductase domain protein n=1 Tax=Berkelbacteria bacterium GW2011_GWA2_38_9 TaxID=1618334 RepID=A0A0G0NWL7_9BACT|nr:MAG: hypothetical protein ACD_83C00046G0006 [uncultured bacterium]KKQ90254.1 MAG: Pyruvate flavodoxin/ferredoxin oxidoreductase domain protein [Berkelbacteria bacterium GW2011_GWA2_38_9]
MVDFQIKIAGAAGDGAMAVGLLASKALSRAGFYIFNYSEYPSLIRGGHNTTTVRASSEPVGSISPKIEIMVALNSESFSMHEDELIDGGILLWDQKESDHHVCKRGIHCIHVPFREISKSLGNPLFLNTVALGALSASLNFSLEFINAALKSEFGRKGEAIVSANIKAAKAGFEFVRKNYKAKLPADLAEFIEEKEDKDRVVMTGNEACALGAIAAGCGFFAAYPMTPASAILDEMSALSAKTGILVKQTEDEISAINMTIGASFAGARVMTATSGGGFALMCESLGLAAMTETPLVLIEAMRPGPATGLPTWTDQGDLRFVLHAAQGEFPRIILSPGDADEAIRLTHLAFDLADEYHIPVIILTDKNLAESSYSATWLTKSEQKFTRYGFISDTQLKHSKDYKRYKITADGVSPRSIPGQAGGIFRANSDEHTEYGFSSEEALNRSQMMEKRFRKTEHLSAHLPKPEVYGHSKPKITLFGFGSTKWAIREAVDILTSKKIKTRAVHLPVCWPLPTVSLSHYINSSERNFVIENNFTGQLEGLIKQETGDVFDGHLRKYDGRPFLAEEVAEYARRKISN